MFGPLLGFGGGGRGGQRLVRSPIGYQGRIPAEVRARAVIGSSGNAAVVRCQHAPDQYYFATTGTGELRVANARRLWNPAALSSGAKTWNPTTWWTFRSGDRNPIVRTQVPGAGPNGGLAVRVQVDNRGTTSGDCLLHFMNDFSNFRGVPRRFTIWLRRNAADSPSVVLNISDHAGSRFVTPDGTWRRYATGLVLNETGNFFCRLRLTSTAAPYDFYVAAEPGYEPCPLVGYGHEYVDPQINGGVRYFAYADPHTVDANGVVTETSTRTSLPGVGVLAVPAATNRVFRSYSHDSGGWTLRSGTNWDSAEGNPLPGLPVPKACVPDGSNSVPGLTASISPITENNPVTVYALFETQVGSGHWWMGIFTLFNSGNSNLSANANDEGNAVESERGVVFKRKIGTGPNGGNLWEVMLHGIIDTGRTASFVTFGPVWNSTNIRKGWVHHLEVRQGYPWQLSVLLVNTSGSSAASRTGDLIDAVWTPGARLVCRLVCDTSLVVPTGALLGGENAAGTTRVPLVAIIDDAGAKRVRVSDGTTTWTCPTTVPAKQDLVIRIDAGPTGVRVSVDGTETTDPAPDLDFGWVATTFIGGLGDGTQAIGIPIQLFRGSY